MKKILNIVAFLGLSASVFAQDLKIAPEVGGTYQTMIQKINDASFETKYQAGLRLGANVDIGLNTNFSIQTGLFLNLNSGAEASFTRNYFLGSGLPAKDQDNRRYHLNYLQIPIYAVFKTGKEFDDPHFFVGVGPYFAAVIGGRFEQEFTNSLNGMDLTKRKDQPISIGTELKDDIKPFDLGVQATIGYEIPIGLYIRAFYGIGLLNVFPGKLPDSHFRNHGGGITVGYFFDLTQKNMWER